MPDYFASLLQSALVALSSVFFLVDPLGAVPTFLAVTAGVTPERRKLMARRASWTCLFALSGFALAGRLVFRLLGITLPAFQIAGGMLLLMIAADMLQAGRSVTQEHAGAPPEAPPPDADPGLMPLGIPMLAGPGAISAVMVLMAQATDWVHAATVLTAVAITSLASFFVLAGALRVRRYFSETAMRVLVRVMGLLLMAIAVQFMIDGLADLGVVHPHLLH
jgi:multiple antibiotic resistance protein